MKIKFILKVGALFLILLSFFAAVDKIDQKSPYDYIIWPYKFNIVRWHLKVWFDEIKLFAPDVLKKDNRTPQEKIALVKYYFSLPEKERTSTQRKEVELILAEQIREILKEEKIYNPLDKTNLFFPPLIFRLERSPNVLVISYRDRIAIKDRILLESGLDDKTKTYIEDEIMKNKLVSALVVPTGGIATYPSMVTERDLKSTIITIVHEWLHQYLVFRPLGFKYLWWTITGYGNEDIVKLNETVASLLGTEIGTLVYERYYKDFQISNSKSRLSPKIDFAKEMRQIRQKVDMFLAQGRIDEAEAYMEERREWLELNGFYIRRLNQAYFAFYGSYQVNPANRGGDNLGELIIELRNKSPSLKYFLETISSIDSRAELEKLVNSK